MLNKYPLLFCVLAGSILTGYSATINKMNLALVATPSTSYVSGHETLNAVNDGFTPSHSNDKRHGAYGNWPRTGTQWVQYEWSQPISTDRIEVYWFDDGRGVRLPAQCRLLYWNGSSFVPVPNPKGLGCEANKFNITTFDEITTTKLRIEMDGRENFSTGILEWRVIDSGKSPNFPPKVIAGQERVVMLGGKTYLDASVLDDGKPNPEPLVKWTKLSGKGSVKFQSDTSLSTTAEFTKAGEYKLQLTADDGASKSSDTVDVIVKEMPPKESLVFIEPISYQITGTFWKDRVKNIIINWIPHCIAKIDDPNLREGGIENFVQAGKKLAGEPARHTGPVFANGWV
ncbi:MAG TPA: Tat pathway signal protein, partial [Verrucomicrobiota bacterium]|nr:Tat pathway signal protein [Verrucomicrobiota bacterium]